jgi:L-alanine-DL-glutamate epimerase-like enolase superfamily enzyme
VLEDLSRGPAIRYRVDANQALKLPEARAACRRLAGLGVELIEEPTSPSALETLWPEGEQPRPALALDESLLEIEVSQLGPLIRQTRAEVVILKPMAHGLARACLLAVAARQSGASVVVSHLMGGPVELCTAAALALAINDDALAAGLGQHQGLDAWRPCELPFHAGTSLRQSERLGLSRPDLGGLSSISDP